jgi:acyl dehydratase
MNQPIGKPTRLYLEDLYIGQQFVSGKHSMDEARIKEFAREFDPQPFHLDEAAAKASVFGIIGLSGDLAWPQPTRPGDTLHVESEILEIVPSRSKPNQAIVKVRSITLNQNGEPVHSFTSKCLVFKRPQLPA